MRNRSLTVLLLITGLMGMAAFQSALAADEFAPQDIGSPSIAGNISAVAGGYNITAGGTNILGTNDQFTFNYRLVTNDFDFKVRVSGLTLADVWSKAGLMARETLVANSRYSATFATPSGNGAYFQARTNVGGVAINSGSYPVNYPNTWLRLRRAANLFTSFASLDGDAWYQLGSATIAAAGALIEIHSHRGFEQVRVRLRGNCESG